MVIDKIATNETVVNVAIAIMYPGAALMCSSIKAVIIDETKDKNSDKRRFLFISYSFPSFLFCDLTSHDVAPREGVEPSLRPSGLWALLVEVPTDCPAKVRALDNQINDYPLESTPNFIVPWLITKDMNP